MVHKDIYGEELKVGDIVVQYGLLGTVMFDAEMDDLIFITTRGSRSDLSITTQKIK